MLTLLNFKYNYIVLGIVTALVLGLILWYSKDEKDREALSTNNIVTKIVLPSLVVGVVGGGVYYYLTNKKETSNDGELLSEGFDD